MAAAGECRKEGATVSIDVYMEGASGVSGWVKVKTAW